MDVKVGILCYGQPEVSGGCVLNAVMGKEFHWQRRYVLRLPADAHVIATLKDMLVVAIPAETYLRSVVGSEMNPEAPPEFLRAHAIVSRSWVAGKMAGIHAEDSLGRIDNDGELRLWADTASHSGFDVCNDDHCQRWQGEQPVSRQALEALESTRSLVLTDVRGTIIDARFSKCCGGMTELFSTCWQDRDYHYLRAVADPWCDPSILTAGERSLLTHTIFKDYDRETTPSYYRWETEVSAAEIEERLRTRFGRSVGRVIDIEALDRGPSGRIHRLLVRGTQGSLRLGKELAVRRLLAPSHLLSACFTIEHRDTVFRLQGKGWGHGVGMCQTGAAVMALRGFTAEKILEHYYPGATISALPNF